MAEAHIERLGQAIKARRKALGWSRARLGREVDAHEKTVERWEKAQTAGALDNLEAIAKALDMDGDALLASAIPKPKNGPAPDPFATESGEATERLRAMVGELLDQQAKLLSDLALLRDDQERLLRQQGIEPAGEDPDVEDALSAAEAAAEELAADERDPSSSRSAQAKP